MVVAFPQQGQGVFAEHTGGIGHGNGRMWNRDGQYVLLVPSKTTTKRSFSGSEIPVQTLQIHLFSKLREDLELEITIIQNCP